MKDQAWLVLAAVAPFLLGCPAPDGGEEGGAATDEMGEVRLVEGERWPDELGDVVLTIASPIDGQVFDEGEVEARLEIRGFQLGAQTPGAEERGIAVSGDGQHVHVIVDNRPYEAIYDLSEPIALDDLEPGAHVLRAFPSRAWHESVKSDGAFAMTPFFVGDSAASPLDPQAPLLTYSRPKGAYEGADADSVMVDFYLTNVELGEGGHAVRVSVDGAEVGTIRRWAPHYLLGLPDGTRRIRLELLDPEGGPVPGPFNVTEREIEISRGDGGEQDAD